MKNRLTAFAAMLLAITSFGQTALPTSWNFDDPQPSGWLESLDNVPGNTRYTNGLVAAACRFDGDDEYVQVHFSDVCGGVTYNLKGQGSAVNDVFTIEESTDGQAWTTLRVLNQAGIDATTTVFVEFTDVPNAASRYIRWIFTEKQSGRNMALDEINLISQVPTTAQEIALNVSGTPVVNNSTYVIGNAASTTFTIENVNLAGGTDLTISNMQIAGPNAGDFWFSNVSTPFNIGPTGTHDFQVNFATAQQGSRFATMIITNNDANGDEVSFEVDLYGIGGDYATEPSAQPNNLSFSDVTSYGYDVSFGAASGSPENYIVLRNIGSAVADLPADGSSYSKGDYINGAQVVHVGPAGSFTPKYVVAGTDYHFAAFAFNGSLEYENYLTTSPLTGSVTSSGSMMGNYYNGVDPSASSFLGDLQTRISQGFDQIFYSNYAPIMINKFASRDTTDGQSVVSCVYSGYKHLYTGAFFYDVISREHSWPHSWMPTFLEGSDGEEYSDMHNLFPTHQNSANAVRSNRPLGEVVVQTSSFLDAQYGDNAVGERVYEPRDQHKGDAARAIFYMAVKWNGTGGTWELPNPIDFAVQYGQDQDVLKQWHWQDPPDAWEISRNDFVESEQGNRNPFVDSVNWVCYIDFETLTYIGEQSSPCTVTPGILEQLAGDFSISPNPTDGVAALNLNLNEAQELTIHVLDITGRTVSTRAKDFNAGVSREMFDLSSLDAGVYHIVLQGESGRTALKVVLR